MSEKLHIFSTCTLQKRGKVDESLHLGNFADLDAREASKRWLQRLDLGGGAGIPARGLYLGSHWKESLEAERTARDLDLNPTLWILSAGYGLLAADETVVPYSASFAPGEDSIQNLKWRDSLAANHRPRNWWNWINQRVEGEGLSRFHEEKEGATYLFILSQEYYAALEHELLELIGAGKNVILVSAGLYRQRNKAAPLVRPHILPFSDRFKQVDPYLNKTNVTLNARLGKWLIENYAEILAEGVDTLTPLLQTVADSVPDPDRKPVNRMTDDEVLMFITKHFGPAHDSATKLLRKLRDEAGLSCEQKRFGSLFRRFQNNQQPDLFGDA